MTKFRLMVEVEAPADSRPEWDAWLVKSELIAVVNDVVEDTEIVVTDVQVIEKIPNRKHRKSIRELNAIYKPTKLMGMPDLTDKEDSP